MPPLLPCALTHSSVCHHQTTRQKDAEKCPNQIKITKNWFERTKTKIPVTHRDMRDNIRSPSYPKDVYLTFTLLVHCLNNRPAVFFRDEPAYLRWFMRIKINMVMIYWSSIQSDYRRSSLIFTVTRMTQWARPKQRSHTTFRFNTAFAVILHMQVELGTLMW